MVKISLPSGVVGHIKAAELMRASPRGVMHAVEDAVATDVVEIYTHCVGCTKDISPRTIASLYTAAKGVLPVGVGVMGSYVIPDGYSPAAVDEANIPLDTRLAFLAAGGHENGMSPSQLER